MSESLDLDARLREVRRVFQTEVIAANVDNEELAELVLAAADVPALVARVRELETAGRAMHYAFLKQFAHHTMASPTIQATLAWEGIMDAKLPIPTASES